MKRAFYLGIVSLLLIVMSACTNEPLGNNQQAAEPEVTVTVAPTATPTSTPTPTPTPVPIPDWKTDAEEVNGIECQYTRAIDNIEETVSPTFVVLGEEIFRIEFYGNYDYSDEATCYSIYLERIDLARGKAAKYHVPNPEKYLYGVCGKAGSDGIYLYNDIDNQMEVYDRSFKLVDTIPLKKKSVYDMGTISADGKSMFYVDENNALRKTSSSGSRVVCKMEKAVKKAFKAYGISTKNDGKIDEYMYVLDVLGEDYVNVCAGYYTDEKYTSYTLSVNQNTGEVDSVEEGCVNMYISPDGQRVLKEGERDEDNMAVYDFLTGQEICKLNIRDSFERYNYDIDWDSNLCFTYNSLDNNNYWEIKAYDLNSGECVKVTADRGNYSYEESYEILPGEGVLFTDRCNDNGESGLWFWDYENTTESDPTAFYTKRGAIAPEVEEYRKELEEKYGIYIYLGPEAAATQFEFNCELCLDSKVQMDTLKVIDDTLKIYPEGFLEQLKSGSIRTLSMYLVGDITGKYDYTISDAAAFACDEGYERYLTMDCYEYRLADTIVHEISHWIDDYIDFAESKTGKYEFEDGMRKYNPEGFEYLGSYVSADYNDKDSMEYCSEQEDLSQVYFIDKYSHTYATEDRARCFEYLMMKDNDYYKCKNIRKKMKYYCDAMRKYFDTTGWPEKTAWEKALDEKNNLYK